MISANWSGFADLGSGIAQYQWAIGSTPGSANIQAFTSVGFATNATATNLTLVNGTTYYVSVRAIDAVGNIGLPAVSDGIQVVTPPPVITDYSDDGGVIGDGLTNDNTPRLSGTAEAGATIRIFDGATLLGQTTAGNDGKWRYTTDTLADGPHVFRADATHVGGGSTSVLSDPLNLSIDMVAPTVSINQDPGQIDPTNVVPINFVVHFSKPVTGFTAASLDLTGSTVNGTPTVIVTGAGADYSVAISGIGGTGVVVVSIPAGGASDAAGNLNLASSSNDNSVSFDNVSPTMTIAPANGQPDPAIAGPIKFAVHFSESVSGFTDADVDLSACTVGGSLSATLTGSGADYEIAVSGMVGAGDVVVNISAGMVSDATSNLNLAYSGTTNRVNFNHVGKLQFSTSSVYTTEGSQLKLLVSRVDGGDGATSVHYSTSDGTAKSPTDYTAIDGTITWAEGDTDPKEINIPITDDTINEGRESFAITLDSPTGGQFSGVLSRTKLQLRQAMA